MKPCVFFVEGIVDARFIQLLLENIGCAQNDIKIFSSLRKYNQDSKTEISIVQLNGWKALKEHGFRSFFDDCSQNKNISIIIDADSEGTDEGGFSARKSAVKNCIGANCTNDVEIYLMHDNESDGSLETLLEGMVKKPELINTCWEKYKQCLATHDLDLDNPPAPKLKLAAYAAAIEPKVRKQLFLNESFSNNDVWNWNATALDPLKTFLREQLTTADI